MNSHMSCLEFILWGFLWFWLGCWIYAIVTTVWNPPKPEDTRTYKEKWLARK